MSNVTRGLTASVLAAMRGGQANTHMEDDREKDNPAEELETETTDPDAEGEAIDPDAEGEGAPGDDPEDADKKDTSANRSARAAERSRIQAILTHPKAEANADLTSHLAFKTSYSAQEAMAILDASSPSASASTGGNRLAGRMAGKTPRLGAGGAPSAQSEKQSLLAAVGGVINARHGRPSNGE